MARVLDEKEPVDFSRKTAIGALANYVANPTVSDFQPMNVNFGIMEPLSERIRKKRERYEKISALALEHIEKVKGEIKNA